MTETDIISVIERQFAAYNQKHAEQWAATYAEHAVQQSIDGTILASGRLEIQRQILSRFQEPDLKAELLQRTVYDNVVIDRERVTRNFNEGLGTIEMLCIYTVEQGLISRAIFKFYNKTLL